MLVSWWTWDSLSQRRYFSSFPLGNGRPPQARSLVIIAGEAVSAGVFVGVGVWLTFWPGGAIAFRTWGCRSGLGKGLAWERVRG